MGRTLNLVELLLTSGRHLCEIGRTTEALDVLTRLAGFRQLPSHIVEEIQALLADIHMQRENYVRARRHLTAALAFRPLNAEYHYMMAIAIEEDDHADLKRAEMYYARAVQEEPDNASYWADYGSYLFRIGKTKSALKAIRKAYKLALHNPEIVAQVGEVLRREDYHEEATTKLRAALFHNPGDLRFREVWQEHQFLSISDQQKRQQDVEKRGDRRQGPVLLPFTPEEQTGKYLELGEKTFRFDEAEPANDPRSPMRLPFRKPPMQG
jgi:tetratricopeptide (TPR) repeat protein